MQLVQRLARFSINVTCHGETGNLNLDVGPRSWFFLPGVGFRDLFFLIDEPGSWS